MILTASWRLTNVTTTLIYTPMCSKKKLPEIKLHFQIFDFLCIDLDTLCYVFFYFSGARFVRKRTKMTNRKNYFSCPPKLNFLSQG